MANMNIRMDEAVKKQAEELFSDLGMNMTTAINIFLKQAIRENKIPFEIRRIEPNQTTIDAFEEGDRIAYDPTVTAYQDISSLRKALDV